MKQIKEWLELRVTESMTAIGIVIGFIPRTMWLFFILELFLFGLCKHTRLEVFVLQFPLTLWVLTAKKDGK